MSYIEKKVEPESLPESKQKADVFSIVIPAYNSAKLLARCLEALEKQSVQKYEFEVTVANDGSTDDTVEMLLQFQTRSELKLQWITIQNSGPGNARNAGVAISSGSWIGLIDADVIPHPDWVENAIILIQQKPDSGAFEGRTEVTQRCRATPFTHQTENIDGGRYPTCNFLVRKSLAHFHPAYLIPFREDTDLAFSILESGYPIIFAPELIVEHPPLPSSYLRPLLLARRYFYDGLLARRFPSRYRHELDAYRVFGQKIIRFICAFTNCFSWSTAAGFFRYRFISARKCISGGISNNRGSKSALCKFVGSFTKRLVGICQSVACASVDDGLFAVSGMVLFSR